MTKVLVSLLAWTFLVLASIVFYRFKVLGIVDFLFLLITYEVNRWRTKRLQTDDSTTSYVACCIGWKEEASTFAECLQSYVQHGRDCALLVVALDGDVDENRAMFDEIQRLFPKQQRQHVSFDTALGDRLERIFEASLGDATNSSPGVLARHQQAALQELIQHLERQLDSVLAKCRLIASAPRTATPQVLVISQPHRGMKPIRFTAWLTGIIAADSVGAEFLWSSDSDSRITKTCIEKTVQTLARYPGGGGACAAMTVYDRDASVLSRMYAGFFQTGVYFQRNPASAAGKVTCITGASACYRVTALRKALPEWYLRRLFGKIQWINEDGSMTKLLARDGWYNIYVPNCLIETAAPQTWMSWFTQLLRWEQAANFERVTSPEINFAVSQGIIPMIVHIRELLVFPIMFAGALVMGLTKDACSSTRFSALWIQLILSFILQGVWSVVTSPESVADITGCSVAIIVYLVSFPFAHVWSMFVLLLEAICTPDLVRTVTRIEKVLFTLWILICSWAAFQWTTHV